MKKTDKPLDTLPLDPSAGPAYTQIGHWLRNEIHTGRFQPSAMMPTEKDLSSRFGVTHMTVRKAYKLLEEDGLVRRQRGAGTFVQHRTAWRKRVSGSRAGIVVWDRKPDPSGYTQSLLEQITRDCAQSELTPLVIEVPHEPDALQKLIVSENLDGLIAFYPNRPSFLAMLEQATIPKLVLEYERKQDGLDNVVIDCYPGVYQAMQRLIILGHERIDYVGGLATNLHTSGPRLIMPQDSVYRLQAWRAALDDAGIPRAKTALHEISFDDEPAEELVKCLSARNTLPTAFLAFDDSIAISLHKALIKIGMQPGVDISLVGFGAFSPQARAGQLASVQVDWPGMARMAVRRLDERLRFQGMGGLTLPVKTNFLDGSSVRAPKKSK